MLWLGFFAWKLCRRNDCPESDRVPHLRDPVWAAQWLQQFKGDGLSMDAMRAVLSQEIAAWQPSRMANEDVIAQFANLLNRGMWHVHTQPVSSRTGGSAARERVEEALEPLRRSSVSMEIPKEITQDETLSGADEAAIADAMKSAAAVGIPFCEECMKT